MDFEAMKVSNLGDAAAELLESAECFSARAAGQADRFICQVFGPKQPKHPRYETGGPSPSDGRILAQTRYIQSLWSNACWRYSHSRLAYDW